MVVGASVGCSLGTSVGTLAGELEGRYEDVGWRELVGTRVGPTVGSPLGLGELSAVNSTFATAMSFSNKLARYWRIIFTLSLRFDPSSNRCGMDKLREYLRDASS